MTGHHAWSCRALFALFLALGVALLPGCRLYQFLTGTGAYYEDPFARSTCTGCTSPDCADCSRSYVDAEPTFEDRPPTAQPDAPYLEEDFVGEPTDADPLDEMVAPEESVEVPERVEPDTLAPEGPSEQPTVPDTMEEDPFDLEFTEPDAPDPDLREPPMEIPEDPFPADTPEQTLPPVLDDEIG